MSNLNLDNIAFEDAATLLTAKLIHKLSEDDQKEFYALYMQGTVGGDDKPSRSGFWFRDGEFWDAWDAKKDLTKE